MMWSIFSGGEPVLYAGKDGRIAGPKAAEFRAWSQIEGVVALSPTGPMVRLPASDPARSFAVAMVFVRDVLRMRVERTVAPDGIDALFPPSPKGIF